MAPTFFRFVPIVLVAVCVSHTAAADDAQPEADKSLTAAAVRFDPGRMPEVESNPPALGWRFGRLSSQQTRVLRRGFKLPLDVLAGAESPKDLIQGAVIAPLPDPSQPMLAVKNPETGVSDPFSGSVTKRTSFRDDPMRALGEWLGVSDAEADAALNASSDPFGSDEVDDFDAEPAAAAEASADEPDPFADEGDDPFADF